MGYDFIIIDSIICESYNQCMYDEQIPYRNHLLDLQKISGDKIANKKQGLLLVTSHTKETMENKYDGNSLPISISCLIGACAEVNIIGADELDSIIKSVSFLNWKKHRFCVLTGNSLLKAKLKEINIEVYDLSEVSHLFSKL